MQPWMYAALVGSLFVAGHYTLLRAASGKIGDTLGAFVLEGSAALGILVAYFFLPRAAPVATTRAGLGFSVASGLCISAVSILLFFALRKGGPVASTGTIVLGGGVTFAAIVAPMIFAEPWTWRRALGVGLGLAAIAVLSTEARAT